MTYLAYLLFPLIGWVFFLRMSMVYAIPSTLVFGYLVLPAGFGIDFPILPSLSKETMPAFVTIALTLMFYRAEGGHDRIARQKSANSRPPAEVLDSWIPRATSVRVLLLVLILGPLFTFVFNRDPVVWPTITLPGIRLFDSVSLVQTTLVGMIAFFVGRRFLAGDEGHRAILLVLAVAGLIYSIPTLIEVRLSPQMHNIVYGYFPGAFIQHIRPTGFRPIVFMPHGLVLSLILCMSALAIVGYMRAIDGDKRVFYFVSALYMLVVVVLSKSLGMALVAGLLVPVVMFGSMRVQMIAAAAILALVMTYPVLRSVGANPLMTVVHAVEPFSPTRAASLEYRLDTERDSMDRFAERPLFGWGHFGRSEARTELGYRTSARDGYWLILLGQTGAAGFIAVFSLFCIPTILLALRQRRYELTFATSGLCIVLAANMIDLLPNSGVTPITWLIVGALLGRVELGAVGQTAMGRTPAAAPTATHATRGPRARAARSQAEASGAAPLAARLRRRPARPEPEAAAPEDADTADADRTPTYSRFATKHVRKPRPG